MPVSYGESRIIPAPLVNIQKEVQRSSDKTKLAVLYTFTLTSKLVAHKGSPQSGTLAGASWGGPYGRFWTDSDYPPDESVPDQSRLKAIENKQEALRTLFATDGEWLEFQSPDGSAPLKAKVRVKSIDFPEGIWHDLCDYTIVCESDTLLLSGAPETDLPFTDIILSANESWQYDADQDRTFKVSHTANAVGAKSIAGNPGWLEAKNFVKTQLMLGISGTSSFSPLTGTTISSTSAFADAGLDIAGLNLYNYSLSESFDELEGSYSVTETWVASPVATALDNYTVSVSKITDEPNTSVKVSIQGNITGFYETLGDFDTKYANAKIVYDTVKGGLAYTRAVAKTQDSGLAVTLNAAPTISEVTLNEYEGVISYTLEYNDKSFSGDVLDVYTVSKESNATDYKTVVSVEGTITGRKYEADTTYLDKFTRAKAAWDAIKSVPVIWQRVEDSDFFTEITDLRQNPISSTVNMDRANGVINYSFRFDNRQNDGDLNNETVQETYTVSQSYSRDDGITTYNIEGTVEGLSVTETSSRDAKWQAALNYFNTVTVGAVVSRVNVYGGVLSDTSPLSISVVKNPTLGVITYTYSYSTRISNCIAGALSETITITEDNEAGDVRVIAEHEIPGRIQGPIAQDMNTTRRKSRSLEIEAVLAPTGGCDYASLYNLKPDTDAIVASLTPSASEVYKLSDVNSWSWKNGRYTRSVNWFYQ